MHVFCDESGNTGTALFDKQQPLFSLASTCVDANVATELITPLLRQGQTEVKYTKLRGTSTGQQQLLDFFGSPHHTFENSKFTLADKKYYLISHLIDKLIEPTLHEAGIDLYANDAHVGLTRVWYYTGFTIFTDGHWEKILEAFLRAVRRRDRDSFAHFDHVLEEAAAHIGYGSEDFAFGLLMSRGRLDEFIGIYQDIEVFDPACDAFASLMQAWMNEVPGAFAVTHDRSKPMKRNEPFLRTLMKPLPARQIGFSSRRGELPLRISDLDFADSSAHAQIQVADLIAGAAIDCLLGWSGKKSSSKYHDAMKDSNLAKLFCGGMLPSPTIEKAADPLQGEASLVDGTTAFLREAGFFKSRS
jgi:hypothetical protein